MKAKSPNDADALVEQRLLAMALDKSKTDLRLIEPDFADRYLKGAVPEVSAAPAPMVKIPGTSITAAPPSQKVEALRALTTSVLQAKAVQTLAASATPGAVTEANRTLTKLDEALDSALDKAGKTSRVTKKRYAAVDRISDASDLLELALGAVAEARSTGAFNPEDLDEALLSLRANLGKLAQLVTRGTSSDGLPAGVSWLRSAALISDVV